MSRATMISEGDVLRAVECPVYQGADMWKAGLKDMRITEYEVLKQEIKGIIRLRILTSEGCQPQTPGKELELFEEELFNHQTYGLTHSKVGKGRLIATDPNLRSSFYEDSVYANSDE